MATNGKQTEVVVRLNGKDLSVPREFFDVAVKASFDQNPQANITTDEFTFILSAYQEIQEWIANGLKSGVGIFEGMPLTMTAGNDSGTLSTFTGIVDLQDNLSINEELGEIGATIKQDNGLNNLADLLEPLDYGYLLNLGVITSNDYVDVDYVVAKKDQTIEAITMLITGYLLAKQLQDSIKDLSETISTITGIAASGATGSLGATLYAIAVAIIQIAYAAAILILLVNLGEALIELLVQPKRTHKAILMKTALEKACQHIGFKFNTTIEDLENLVYLPSNITTDDYGDSIFLEIPGVIKQGIPNATDIGYTCTEMFNIARNTFNGRFLIDKDTVQFHSENSDFWIKRASWIKPDAIVDRTKVPIRYNTDEIKSSININFKTDTTDEYTIDEFRGTVYQVLTDAKTINVVQNKAIKNFDEVAIPMALGTRKEKLTGFEKLLANVAGIFDELAGVFGGSSNLKSKVKSKIGVLKVSFNNHAVPKLLWMEGNRIPANHRELFSAKTLWEKYHIEKSFVANGNSRQRKIVEGEKIPFGFNDYVEVTNNSYFHDKNGKLGKIIELEWTMNKDYAIISYWQSRPYTRNLKETFIEPPL